MLLPFILFEMVNLNLKNLLVYGFWIFGQDFCMFKAIDGFIKYLQYFLDVLD